jgi:hypothetical protein
MTKKLSPKPETQDQAIAPVQPEVLPETKPAVNEIEFTFDFSRISLDDVLDAMEYQAKIHSGKNAIQDTLQIMQISRRAFVSSSRPATGEDSNAFISAFWSAFGLMQNPKN